jgi:hypothetical protein
VREGDEEMEVLFSTAVFRPLSPHLALAYGMKWKRRWYRKYIRTTTTNGGDVTTLSGTYIHLHHHHYGQPPTSTTPFHSIPKTPNSHLSLGRSIVRIIDLGKLRSKPRLPKQHHRGGENTREAEHFDARRLDQTYSTKDRGLKSVFKIVIP